MHIASGLKIPVIGLFGPTKAFEWGPMGTDKYSIQSKNGMMEGISAESVYGLCTEILEMKAKYKENA
jgi:ADP-heptose:LPS heptosyltransferase